MCLTGVLVGFVPRGGLVKPVSALQSNLKLKTVFLNVLGL